MNPAMLHERLTRLISEYAATAMSSRQVARRLADLLPTRFAEIKRDHRRRMGGGDAERLALTDPRYVAAIEELSRVAGDATLARVQYETHVLLYKARQSLRRIRR